MDGTSELKTEDLLDNVTSSLQRGDDIEPLVLQESLLQAGVEDLIDIIADLDTALIPVEPRVEFSDQLRAQLLNERGGVMKRVRQMPARVHVAALLAVIAGFCLLWTRRLSGAETRQDITDEPIAAPL